MGLNWFLSVSARLKRAPIPVFLSDLLPKSRPLGKILELGEIQDTKCYFLISAEFSYEILESNALHAVQMRNARKNGVSANGSPVSRAVLGIWVLLTGLGSIYSSKPHLPKESDDKSVHSSMWCCFDYLQGSSKFFFLCRKHRELKVTLCVLPQPLSPL